MGLSKEELLDAEYWENRYLGNQLGWDIGYASTPLKTYFDQLTDKHLRILIPGAGNAYETEYLHQQGFKNIHAIDLAPSALKNLHKRIPDFPVDHLIEGNFFEHHNQYNLIVEQTFFCALHPELRKEYAAHMHRNLSPGGKLVGLLFDDALNTEHPPYGGDRNEYLAYFEPWFHIETFERCYNSIPPRSDRELFMILRKQ